MVTAEVVENSLNDYAANFVTQEMIANFVNTDVVEGSLNQLNDDLRAELDDIRNNQPVPEASNQEEELQHVHNKITEHHTNVKPADLLAQSKTKAVSDKKPEHVSHTKIYSKKTKTRHN